MDLSSIDLAAAAGKPRTLHLRHPVEGHLLYDNGGKEEDMTKPVTIDLLGSSSKQFKAALNRSLRDRTENRTIDDIERNSSRNLAALVVGWKNIGWSGEPLACNAANAEMLFVERPWIRKQVDAFVANDQNFWSAPDAK